MWPFRKKHEANAFAPSGLASPEAWFADAIAGGGATLAGERAGPASAMRVPAVNAAVRTISETIASLEIRVKNVGQVDADHSVNRLLWRPNPWTSAFEFRRDLITDAILHGRGLAIAARGGGGVRELHRVPRAVLRLDQSDMTWEPTYVLQLRGGGERRYDFRDVVDIVPLTGADGQPLSIVAAASEAIGFARVLQAHGSRLFANGGRPSATLAVKPPAGGEVSPAMLAKIREGWALAFGPGRSGGTAVLPGDITFSQLALSSVDAQFLELWRFVVLEIARAFRVPPHMLADLERTTHSNAEEMSLQFIALCLRPWCELITGALQRVVFTEAEQQTHWLEFDFGDLLRPNTLQLFEAVTKAVGGPTLTANEGRGLAHGLGAIAGGDKLNQPQGAANAPDKLAPAPAPLRAVA